MRPIKIYSASPVSVFVPHEALRLLNEPTHRSQGHICIAATSKASAARILSERFHNHFTGHVMEEGCGKTVDALVAGGLLTVEGEVYITPLNSGRDDGVVAVTESLIFRRCGRLAHGNHWRDPYTFVAEENH